MERKVKINGTNLVVSVPIYSTDWVKFLAVDKDGEIWMYEHAPHAGANIWSCDQSIPNTDIERLPEEGGENPHERINMHGIDWKLTLTSVTAAIAKEKTGLIDDVCHRAAGIYRASSEEAAQGIINEIRAKLEGSL